VWQYLISVELKDELDTYETKRAALQGAIDSLTEKINTKLKLRTEKQKQIRDLESQITSIQPTVDAINALLKSFGYVGFALETHKDGKSYRIVRPDGKDAKYTLSEGERSFVSFLYFYHLLRGSDSESGITINRVVVFDDPVSSLDGDILYIVSSLIKGVIDEVRAGNGLIKQVFVLTHNVYFHKEVTFHRDRSQDDAMKDETFWIVTKSGLDSRVKRYPKNPIKTSYEMLWEEVRNPNRSKVTIQNTLRRILENYFKILGKIDPDSICAMFDGNDRLICKSLFAWVNDGSHNAFEDPWRGSPWMRR